MNAIITMTNITHAMLVNLFFNFNHPFMYFCIIELTNSKLGTIICMQLPQLFKLTLVYIPMIKKTADIPNPKTDDNIIFSAKYIRIITLMRHTITITA